MVIGAIGAPRHRAGVESHVLTPAIAASLSRALAADAVDYPGREKFARLTKQEERHGLYEDTSRIGRRDGWNFALDEKQVQLRGHQLVRRSATPE
jgi:hypothetical protein